MAARLPRLRPVGVIGTLWSYWKLEERGERRPGRIDWWGNLTFGVGLVLVLVSITDGIQPYGGHTMGWTTRAPSPRASAASPCSEPSR